jgi:3D (Asp-Asp-Asp) domain-containing protein
MKYFLIIMSVSLLSVGVGSLALCPVSVINEPARERVQVIITAYSSTTDQTDSTPFITASGRRVRPGIVAVSRDLKDILDFGQIVYLEGVGYFVVEDVMHERWTNRVDIWYPSRLKALHFGVKQGTLRWDDKIISLMGVE